VGFEIDNVLHVRHSFPVPHTEGEQVSADLTFHKELMQLHRKVAPKEVLLGWYSTGALIDDASVIIHDFFSHETAGGAPMHMTVDTTLTNDTMACRAWTHVPVTLAEKELGAHFLPLPLLIDAHSHHAIALDAVRPEEAGTMQALQSELLTVQRSVGQLALLIDSIRSYVQRVLEGSVEGDKRVGRFLVAALAALPKLDAASVERLVQAHVHDLLLVVYLASLTRAQLQIADKLTKAL